MQIVRAPVADVWIDELRPEPNQVRGYARAHVDIELERRARSVRGDDGLEAGVDRRAPGVERIDNQAGLRGDEANLSHKRRQAHRLVPAALGAESGVVRFEPRGPNPGRVGRRRDPSVRGKVRLAREEGEFVDPKALLAALPSD